MFFDLTNHSFRIFYGDNFGRFVAYVINSIGEVEIDFALKWHKDYADIVLKRVSRDEWMEILEDLFDQIYANIGTNEDGEEE